MKAVDKLRSCLESDLAAAKRSRESAISAMNVADALIMSITGTINRLDRFLSEEESQTQGLGAQR